MRSADSLVGEIGLACFGTLTADLASDKSPDRSVASLGCSEADENEPSPCLVARAATAARITTTPMPDAAYTAGLRPAFDASADFTPLPSCAALASFAALAALVSFAALALLLPACACLPLLLLLPWLLPTGVADESS